MHGTNVKITKNILAKTGQQIVPALFTENLHLWQHIEDLEIYIPLQERNKLTKYNMKCDIAQSQIDNKPTRKPTLNPLMPEPLEAFPF
jgi:hypothetical protein